MCSSSFVTFQYIPKCLGKQVLNLNALVLKDSNLFDGLDDGFPIQFFKSAKMQQFLDPRFCLRNRIGGNFQLLQLERERFLLCVIVLLIANEVLTGNQLDPIIFISTLLQFSDTCQGGFEAL